MVDAGGQRKFRPASKLATFRAPFEASVLHQGKVQNRTADNDIKVCIRKR